MYESSNDPLLSRRQFAWRLAGHLGAALVLAACSLLVGMGGYIGLEHLSWPDALLDSAMLLGGMGPVHPPQTLGGKLFAAGFALYAGLVFIVSAALLMTPLLHRLMHHFHVDDDRDDAT